MRIDQGGGTRTYITERHGKGLSVIQGRSTVMLSKAEAKVLNEALSEYLSRDSGDNFRSQSR